MKTINIDDAAELAIVCKKGRDFDLEVDLKRPLSGESFSMAVMEDDLEILRFELGNGLSVSGTKVRLQKTHSEMDVSTGCFMYDLVELKDGAANNLLVGAFTIKPSSTAL
jgi:hypothetical protein